MLRALPFSLLCAALVTAAPLPGQAQTREENWQVCVDENDDIDPSIEATITACTAFLLSAREPPDKVVEALTSRADAYTDDDNPNKDYARSLADYTAALRLAPRDSGLWWLRGATYSAINDHDRAIADYNRSLALDPTDYLVWDYLADAYRRKGDLPRALAELDRAVRFMRDPFDLAGIFRKRGQIYSGSGHYRRAIYDFDLSLALDNGAYTLCSRGEARLLSGDVSGGEADIAVAVKTEPVLCSREFLASNAGNRSATTVPADEFGAADIDRLIPDYNGAIQLAPKNTVLLRFRGNLYALKRDQDRAIADYNRALALQPGNEELAVLMTVRGGAYSEKGDQRRAQADLDQAIALRPTFAIAFYNRCLARKRAGDEVGGNADLARATELDPAFAARVCAR